jgi:mannitol/fructose-specific phosphotransferase system IIA component (Ntr-type)
VPTFVDANSVQYEKSPLEMLALAADEANHRRLIILEAVVHLLNLQTYLKQLRDARREHDLPDKDACLEKIVTKGSCF